MQSIAILQFYDNLRFDSLTCTVRLRNQQQANLCASSVVNAVMLTFVYLLPSATPESYQMSLKDLECMIVQAGRVAEGFALRMDSGLCRRADVRALMGQYLVGA